MFILYYISSWFSTRFLILETDSSPLRRNELNRQKLGPWQPDEEKKQKPNTICVEHHDKQTT
jgi:hypothetical protein